MRILRIVTVFDIRLRALLVAFVPMTWSDNLR